MKSFERVLVSHVNYYFFLFNQISLYSENELQVSFMTSYLPKLFHEITEKYTLFKDLNTLEFKNSVLLHSRPCYSRSIAA